MMRMDSGPLFDVMRTDASPASYRLCEAPGPWSPPDFSFGGHENSLAETINVLKELDSGGSSPMAPNEASPGGGPDQTSAIENDSQAPKQPAPKTRRKSYSEADRVERRRARNRAAQARFRQKQRDARNALETQIFERQREISSLRATCASLRQHKQATTERLNAANTALAELVAEHTSHGPTHGSPTLTLCSNAPTTLDGHGAALPNMSSPKSSPRSGPPALFPTPPQLSPEYAAEHGQRPAHTHFPHACGHAPPAQLPQHRAVLVQSTARSTQHALSKLPPPIASFAHCDGISYRDILEASGAPGPFVDFSQASLRSLVGACKARKAAAAQAVPADVCWFLMSEYEAAPGLPLSYSATLSTPECVASLAIHYLLLTFEFALCTAAADHRVTEAMSGSPKCSGSRAPASPMSTSHPQTSTSPRDRPQSALHSESRGLKRVSSSQGDPRPRPHPDRSPLEQQSSVHNRGAAPTEGPPGPPPLESLHAGLARTMSASDTGPPSDMHASAAHTTDSPHVNFPTPFGVGGGPPGEAGGSMPQQPAPAPSLWGGEVTCGVNQRTGARGAIRTCVRAIVAAFGAWVQPPLLQRLCLAHADHMAELLRTFPAQAADMHGAEDELDDVEGFVYHTGVTAALGFVLGELRDSMQDMAGLINVMAAMHPQAAPPASPRGAPWRGAAWPPGGGTSDTAALQRRGFVALVSFNMCHVLTLTDAGRVMRRLAVNGTIPVMKNYEVDNLHVRMYRKLHPSPAQRVSLAAHWHLWERRRRTLDTPIATARSLLSSLPQFIPLPASFARRVFDLADGTAAPAPHAQHAQHAQHEFAPWDQEPVVPLLGAAADVTGAADEAVRLLSYSLAAESGVGVETTGQRLQPGELLSLGQLLRVYSFHLLHRDVPPVDFLALCQLAAMQIRWEESREREGYAQWRALQNNMGPGAPPQSLGQWGRGGAP